MNESSQKKSTINWIGGALGLVFCRFFGLVGGAAFILTEYLLMRVVKNQPVRLVIAAVVGVGAWSITISGQIEYSRTHWDKKFKDTNISACIKEGGGEAYPNYCKCMMDKVEASGEVASMYNKYFSSEKEALIEAEADMERYLASDQSTTDAKACLR